MKRLLLVNKSSASLAASLAERRHAAQGGRPGRADEVTIAEVLTIYASEHAPETATPERIAYAMDALLAFWEDSTIDAIRSATCKRYQVERRVSDGTIRRELGVLRAACRHAVKAGRLIAAPEFTLPPPPCAPVAVCQV